MAPPSGHQATYFSFQRRGFSSDDAVLATVNAAIDHMDEGNDSSIEEEAVDSFSSSEEDTEEDDVATMETDTEDEDTDDDLSDDEEEDEVLDDDDLDASLDDEEQDDDGIDPTVVPVEGELTMMDRIKDGIVSASTYRGYVCDNLQFVRWCQDHKPQWLTDNCCQELQDLADPVEGEGVRTYQKRVKTRFESMLRNAFDVPIMHLNLITTKGFMEYITTLRNQTTGDYLSKSAYGSHCSALFHLFWLH